MKFDISFSTYPTLFCESCGYYPINKKQTNMESITLSELSMKYFPNHSKQHARRLFNQMLKKNGKLQHALVATCFNSSVRYLTPMQLSLIFEYLGEP